MGNRPQRLELLPEQYFVGLLGRVAAAAAAGGEPLVDLGRGNPETGPPPHVVEALREAVLDPGIHGYSPIRGLSRTKEAIAARYGDVFRPMPALPPAPRAPKAPPSAGFIA